MVRVGVLALQGAFSLHKPHLEALGAEYFEVTRPIDFGRIDALILPGGESSVMLKLLESLEMNQAFIAFLKSERPVWGICAGAILLSKRVRNPVQISFGLIDIEIQRNSYGRQLESFDSDIDGYTVSFIRAPRILSVGAHIEIRSTQDGSPTWIECDHFTLTTFHPELNLNFPSPWHERLVQKARETSPKA